MKAEMIERRKTVMQGELMQHLKPFRYGVAAMLAALGLEDVSGVQVAVATAAATLLAMIIANMGAGLMYAVSAKQRPLCHIQKVMAVFKWTSTTISYFSVALLLLFIIDLLTLNKLSSTAVYLYLIGAVCYSLAYFVQSTRSEMRSTG